MTYLATDSRSSLLDRFHSRGHSILLRTPSLFVDNKTPPTARSGRPTVLSSTNNLSTEIMLSRGFSQIGEGRYPSRCVWEAHQRPGHTYILTRSRLRHLAYQLGFQPRTRRISQPPLSASLLDDEIPSVPFPAFPPLFSSPPPLTESPAPPPVPCNSYNSSFSSQQSHLPRCWLGFSRDPDPRCKPRDIPPKDANPRDPHRTEPDFLVRTRRPEPSSDARPIH